MTDGLPHKTVSVANADYIAVCKDGANFVLTDRSTWTSVLIAAFTLAHVEIGDESVKALSVVIVFVICAYNAWRKGPGQTMFVKRLAPGQKASVEVGLSGNTCTCPRCVDNDKPSPVEVNIKKES